ncbi:bile acid:sodium symporter family protein [Phragmitibacter flavus]|uniref:bile acid:sodium symporter family protein n=1 Tax=Phragmitibacter flavus TaxID=2576071 RepID=UPI001408E5D0|nr:bile acid:sodium symporter family protein [Phragmitibacter flavus]
MKNPSPNSSWLRTNGFLIGLFIAVILAFIVPGPGSRHGILQPELLNNVGIALILFLQGLSLAVEKIKSGAANWRLHLIIQGYTFVIFPLVGLLFHFIVPMIWTTEPAAIKDGFLYLCVLPSTISTSVVLTAVARGNTAGALFNAALSNIAGVILTPVLVHLLMQRSGVAADTSTPFGPLLLKITLLTLLPFAVGMLIRPRIKGFVDANKAWVTRISNAVILFIVYTAFCDSVEQDIWHRYGPLLTVQTIAVVIALFTLISLLVHLSSRALKLNREDHIAAYFCSVKKTLAMGVPLAMLIFGDRADLSLILLPIMFYHPLQLFVNGLLANRWAKAGL